MENSYKSNKILQLLEFDHLVKFNMNALENCIKSIDEELLVVTILGSKHSNQHDLTNLIIDKENFFTENETGVWIYANTLDHNSPNIKILILNVCGVDSEEFNEKIYTMLHCISSIIIFHTSKPNLSDLSLLSKVSKTLNGTNYPEDLLADLAPKFIFILRKNDDESYYSNLQKQFDNERKSANFLMESIEKEDEYKEIFTKLYNDRRGYILNNYFNHDDIKEIVDTIHVNSFCKTYRGKKNYGLTLRNLLIEFVNCINQKISFNIPKM